MEYVLPADFPAEPNGLGHNQQWFPIATEAYQGWIKIPVELNAQQLTVWQNSTAAALLDDPKTWERPEGEDRPEILVLYEGVHHLVYHCQFDHVDSQAIADKTGRSLPSVQLARAIFYACNPLIQKAYRLGNSLRPFSGIQKPGTANGAPDGTE